MAAARQELFDSLAEANHEQAWGATYTDEENHSHTIVMFGESEEEVRELFGELASDEVELANVNEW